MGWAGFGLMSEDEASEVALERLVHSAFTDGMLPEAYDPDGSGQAVRQSLARSASHVKPAFGTSSRACRT